MTLREICTSLELSKKLAEAGVSQEGGLCRWFDHPVYEWRITQRDKHYYEKVETYRAFTFNELWKQLPNCIENEDEIYYKRFLPPAIMIYAKGAEPRWLKKYEGDTPQEAAGELLLWCIEQGFYNPKED